MNEITIGKKSVYEKYKEECQAIVDVIAGNVRNDGFCHLTLSQIAQKIGKESSYGHVVKQRLGALSYGNGSIEVIELPTRRYEAKYRVKYTDITNDGFFRDILLVTCLYCLFDDEKLKEAKINRSDFFGMPLRDYQRAIKFLSDEESFKYLLEESKALSEECKQVVASYVKKFPALLRDSALINN